MNQVLENVWLDHWYLVVWEINWLHVLISPENSTVQKFQIILAHVENFQRWHSLQCFGVQSGNSIFRQTEISQPIQASKCELFNLIYIISAQIKFLNIWRNLLDLIVPQDRNVIAATLYHSDLIQFMVMFQENLGIFTIFNIKNRTVAGDLRSISKFIAKIIHCTYELGAQQNYYQYH
jgi:hypothetical protein